MKIIQKTQTYLFITLEKQDRVDGIKNITVDSLIISHYQTETVYNNLTLWDLKKLVRGKDITIQIQRGLRDLKEWIHEFKLMDPKTLSYMKFKGDEIMLFRSQYFY